MIRKSGHIKKLRTTIGWAAILIGIAVLTFLSVQHKAKQSVSDLRVVIHSPKGKKSLITKKETRKMIEGYLGYQLEQANITEINLIELEQLFQDDERIGLAELYLNSNNELTVALREKNVVARVQEGNISYYLDENGEKVNSRRYRAVRVPVVTGQLEPHSLGLFSAKKRSNLKDALTLVKALEEDDFLKALIEQIHFDKSGKVTMVPKLGKEKISLTVIDLEEKLFKLKAFYKEKLPEKGWSTYALLNLDVKGQVVAERIN